MNKFSTSSGHVSGFRTNARLFRRAFLIILLVLAIIISNFGLFIYLNDMKTSQYIHSLPIKPDNDKWVILLHGLLRGSQSMKRIEDALKMNGYHTLNFNYSSRNHSIRQIAHQLDAEIQKLIPKKRGSINFVTHSLGSIIVRYYLARFKIGNIGRFVMIAPPNRGSIWGRKLVTALPFMKSILGVAGDEVKNSPDLRLPDPPPCEFGIIAGGLGNGSGFNPFIPGDDDFTIGVSETRLKGMKDSVIIKGQHSTLLFQRRVINNVISFLGTGKFLY